jgi:hypothetical protein
MNNVLRFYLGNHFVKRMALFPHMLSFPLRITFATSAPCFLWNFLSSYSSPKWSQEIPSCCNMINGHKGQMRVNLKVSLAINSEQQLGYLTAFFCFKCPMICHTLLLREACDTQHLAWSPSQSQVMSKCVPTWCSIVTSDSFASFRMVLEPVKILNLISTRPVNGVDYLLELFLTHYHEQTLLNLTCFHNHDAIKFIYPYLRLVMRAFVNEWCCWSSNAVLIHLS